MVASLEQCSLDQGYCLPSTPIGKVRLVGIVGLGIAKVLSNGRPYDLAHWGIIGQASFFKGIGLGLGQSHQNLFVFNRHGVGLGWLGIRANLGVGIWPTW